MHKSMMTMMMMMIIWTWKRSFDCMHICVVSVFLYGLETWTLTESEWARLQSFHMQCKRRIFVIKWTDFITNEWARHTTCLDVMRDIIQVTWHDYPDDSASTIVAQTCCTARDGTPRTQLAGVHPADHAPRGFIKYAQMRRRSFDYWCIHPRTGQDGQRPLYRLQADDVLLLPG